MIIELNEKNKNIIELIYDKEKKAVLFDEENKECKKYFENYKNDINNVNIELKGYIEHLYILNKQNNILSKELNYIYERDNELNDEFQIIEHLKEVANKNNNLIKNCIDN